MSATSRKPRLAWSAIGTKPHEESGGRSSRSPRATRRFWRVYAHGTYQNFPTVGLHLNFQQPGNYLFDLTPKPLDIDRLAPGRYEVRVTAATVCGNTHPVHTRSQRAIARAMRRPRPYREPSRC
jgi:hypothetical protein